MAASMPAARKPAAEGDGDEESRDAKGWKTASGGSSLSGSCAGGGGGGGEGTASAAVSATVITGSSGSNSSSDSNSNSSSSSSSTSVSNEEEEEEEEEASTVPSPLELEPEQQEDGYGACSACGTAFLSPESVRWHPLVTLPQCLACFSRGNSLLMLVLVQQHHDHNQQYQPQPQPQPHQQGVEEGAQRKKRARPPTPVPLRGLVCLWCLAVLPEEADDVLRCGPRSPLPKHPLCPARTATAASRLVMCQPCLAAHAGAARADLWRARHAEGAWACFICDKLPLLELALEKGWGLPAYPQDLRMSAEVQE